MQTSPRPVIERELTANVMLTDSRGRLNPDAVGFTRGKTVVNTDGVGQGLFGKGRNKRWEYWAVMTPRHIIALVVSDIDYASVPSLWVLDRETNRTYASDAIAPFGAGTTLPGSLDHGHARVNLKNVKISIDVDGPRAQQIRLRAIGPEIRLDAWVTRHVDHEYLGLVVPWSDRLFQYTVKDVALPVTGTVWVAGERFDFSEDSWAILDHGRGRWPYDIMWNWGAGCGRSGENVLGIQFGDKWTDGTGTVENSVLVNGKLTKISEELVWEYDTSNWMSPWRVWGSTIDVTLRPFHIKSSRTDLKVLTGRTDQAFGIWSGWFKDDDGVTYDFDNLIGFAEEVHNRW
ncbi:MAG: DUF2804 domain-containing protein [Actinomycetaceae bacterium]|nr:DUF2804 domain-containing protein [Actinomycetaceae bacterium]